MKINKIIVLALPVLLMSSVVKTVLAVPITFGSDNTWNVLDSSNASIGAAQYVCLNSTIPSTCNSSSTIYGFSGNPNAWGADLSSLPDSSWIWAPGITGSTSSASLEQYSFMKDFNLVGVPQSGSISVSVDDFAEIFVNNISVGTVGSITDFSLASSAQSFLGTFDITSFLVEGNNSIKVTAQNGPDSFSGITNSNYSQNPAGVVFGGHFNVTSVPEPSTLFLFMVGSLFLVGTWRHTNISKRLDLE